MKIDEQKVISNSAAVTYHYVAGDKVYDCLFCRNEMWLSFSALCELCENAGKTLANALAKAFNGVLDENSAHKYYFRDGNTQSYMGAHTNYYNLSAVIYAAITTGYEGLYSYIEWARKTLLSAVQENSEQLSTGKKNGCFVYVNRFEHGVQDVIVPHKHNCYELVYYVGGKGKTACESGIFEYKAGTLFLVKPQEMHEEYVTEPSECLCLAFNTDYSLKTGVIYRDDKNAGDLQAICGYVNEIYELSFKKDASAEIENQAILVAFLLNKIMQGHEKRTRFSDETVEYVKQYIEMNYGYKINFAILSERIGYSLSHLNSLFKEKENAPLYSYLSRVRLLKAKEMLRAGDEKMLAISKKCGFQSESRFSQFFKEKTGVSPQTYRQISNDEIENGVLIAGKRK